MCFLTVKFWHEKSKKTAKFFWMAMTNTFCSESYLFCVPLKPVTAAVWAGGCPGGATNPIFGFLIGELSPHQGWTDRSILTDSPVELRRKYSLYFLHPAMNWEERISRIFCILIISRTNWIFICRIFPPKLARFHTRRHTVRNVS